METSIAVFSFSCFSILIVFICIALLICYRNTPIIKGGSWRLNIIICFGAFLAYLRVILYCVDEVHLTGYSNVQEILNKTCNIRTWMVTICFTLLFIPLFAKTYRLSQIFNGILAHRNISDNKLFMLVLGNLLIDVVILSIVTWWKPLSRYHIHETPVPIDELQSEQDVYYVCSFEPQNYFGPYYFYVYGIITAWKLIQTSWGIHVCCNVSRINVGDGKTVFSKLWQLEETGVQIFSLLFTFVAVAVAVPIFVIGILHEQMALHYLVMVVAMLLIVNVIVWLNVAPRIIAVVCCHKTVKFRRSPSEQIKVAVERELTRLGWVYDELNKIYTHRGSEDNISAASLTYNASLPSNRHKSKSKTNPNLKKESYKMEEMWEEQEITILSQEKVEMHVTHLIIMVVVKIVVNVVVDLVIRSIGIITITVNTPIIHFQVIHENPKIATVKIRIIETILV